MIWDSVTRASRRANYAAGVSLMYTPYAQKYITEVMLVPAYASVKARRELWRIRRHPKNNRALNFLKEL
jgi:hypothetical protein